MSEQQLSKVVERTFQRFVKEVGEPTLQGDRLALEVMSQFLEIQLQVLDNASAVQRRGVLRSILKVNSALGQLAAIWAEEQATLEDPNGGTPN